MNDLQMARGEIEGGYNLAIGEPVVLQEHLRFPIFETQGPFTYPTLEGYPPLVEELQRLYPDQHVVVANGGKQALLAAFYALNRLEGRQIVHHAQPFWPSYRTLARMSGLDFEDPPLWEGWYDQFTQLRPRRSRVIQVVTSPNNPDGRQLQSWNDGSFDVWDAVYAHWVYGWNGYEPPHRIRVGSASKLLGLSGVRVGWLVTRADRLAALAREYVEITTSGVSVVAQEYVANALRLMREINPMVQLRAAREAILQNGESFKRHLGHHMQAVDGVPDTGVGMFAFAFPRDPERFSRACAAAKVAVVTGGACGNYQGRFRMSMAHNVNYTEEALQALRKELDHAL